MEFGITLLTQAENLTRYTLTSDFKTLDNRMAVIIRGKITAKITVVTIGKMGEWEEQTEESFWWANGTDVWWWEV